MNLSAGCADLQALDTMQPVERKRQGYIHELIQTEERYMDDLQLVVEVRVAAVSATLAWRQCVFFRFAVLGVKPLTCHTRFTSELGTTSM